MRATAKPAAVELRSLPRSAVHSLGAAPPTLMVGVQANKRKLAAWEAQQAEEARKQVGRWVCPTGTGRGLRAWM